MGNGSDKRLAARRHLFVVFGVKNRTFPYEKLQKNPSPTLE